jgi:hypothetical protein
MIDNGVTRAARIYWWDPTATVTVTVTQETELDLTHLPLIRDVVVPR